LKAKWVCESYIYIYNIYNFINEIFLCYLNDLLNKQNPFTVVTHAVTHCSSSLTPKSKNKISKLLFKMAIFSFKVHKKLLLIGYVT